MSFISVEQHPVFARRAATRRAPWRDVEPARLAGLGFVVALHIVMIYVLAISLATRAPLAPPGPLQIAMIKEARPDEVRLPPPVPVFAPPPPVYVPPPEITIQQPTTSVSTAIQAVTTTRPVAAPMPPVAAPAPVARPRIEPEIDSGHSRDPEYPPLSRRLNEEGLVSLLVLVGADGSVQDVRVEKSSGFDRLDQAAIDGARNRSRFIAGQLDGKPAIMWYRYRYEFHVG